MHASLIKAQEYRDQEKRRRIANRERRAKNEQLRAEGKDPARTPTKFPDGNHKARRAESREDRQMLRFFRNLSDLFNGKLNKRKK